ncbi:HAMP domain-containing sensor histidine kinase [Antrihabitans cavernicola]|uniref:histidine kinase n=1 Tax=Antrihabitans cavernicola TaxID=2495913 RepID=A0A5A7SD96_9NOCA|nr:HAMP domain-containing sensor histidine kinase [Spelaeibacter cavernicola]KAA0022465.1 HAMP domain-containing histidine kinase [Spelaeibacter cavernicola]
MSTHTPSLRRRVTLTVLGLFALLLVLVGIAVDVALGAQLRKDLDARIADRIQRATSLAESGTTPEQLVSALNGPGIRVRVTTADGQSYGDPGVPSTPDACPPPPPAPGNGPIPPAPPCPPPGPPDAAPTIVTRDLPNGSSVTLLGDTAQIADVRKELREVMIAAAVATLAVAGVVLYISIGQALRPLQAMTAVARQITAGDRGRRLRPDRSSSDLGQSASAFDGMLDALEHAETRERDAAEAARLAEADTRRFLSDAAHELRTPVAGIQNIAETLARDDGTRPERRARFTELLVTESGQAARLVADMLELARIDSDLPPNTVATDLVRIADNEVERAKLLVTDLTIERTGIDTAPVTVDPDRIGRVLRNLLNNALRHTPSGGRIVVEVSTTATEAAVTVTDTGPGIPDAERERIFTRLVRLQEARDRDSGGSGLGLTIARGLARAHHGDLTCEPCTSGAEFVLTLPLQSA